MDILGYLITPLMGMVIGYFTNWIAIKMLFRPSYPHYLFGRRLPFTPGLIPKEKHRIAHTIGQTISKNLINKDVLSKNLLSEDVKGKIAASIDKYVDSLSSETSSLRDYLYSLLSKREVDTVLINAKDDVSSLIYEKLNNPIIGETIAKSAVEYAIEKIKHGLLGLIGLDKIVSFLSDIAEELLAKNINEMLKANSKTMVESVLGTESDKFLEKRVCDLVYSKSEKIAQIKGLILSAYNKVITDYLPQILETVNISGMVENKLNEMNVKETEALVLQVMNKELKAIIWLGALLGLIMGILTLVINSVSL